MYPRVEQIGDKWYYWLGAWEAVKGPFDSLTAANEAATVELQTRHGT